MRTPGLAVGMITLFSTTTAFTAPASTASASTASGAGASASSAASSTASHVTPPPAALACREVWRAGGESDLAGEVLGFVTDVDRDEDGYTYLLDYSFNRIHVFDADGAYLRSIGREGDGPGEWRKAERFLVLPDGHLGALPPYSTKIVAISRDGLPGPTIDFGNGEGLEHLGLVDTAGDRIVAGLTETETIAGDRCVVSTLATYDREGRALSTILRRVVKRTEQGRAVDEDGNGGFGDHWAVGPGGAIYVSRRPHEYRIEVFDLDGTLRHVIERAYEPLRLSDEDLAKEKERIERLRRMTRGSGIDFQVDPYERDIAALHARPGGELWVETSRGLLARPEGCIGVFDVFDAAGALVRRLYIQAGFDPERDTFELIGNYLYVIKEGQMRPSSVSVVGEMTVYYENDKLEDVAGASEEKPLEVICYRLAG